MIRPPGRRNKTPTIVKLLVTVLTFNSKMGSTTTSLATFLLEEVREDVIQNYVLHTDLCTNVCPLEGRIGS